LDVGATDGTEEGVDRQVMSPVDAAMIWDDDSRSWHKYPAKASPSNDDVSELSSAPGVRTILIRITTDPSDKDTAIFIGGM
jgi:hypothetical protein